MCPETPYNPLAKRNLAESIQKAMLSRPVIKLPPTTPFEGAGIYAIYYVGKFPPYKAIAEANKRDWSAPLYVGKADPKGGRAGGDLDLPHGRVLYSRLKKHAESIKDANNLNLDDFYCRYLIVDDVWIPLGERLLIQLFKPVWNSKLLTGFGSNVPGKERTGKRSPWDTIHAGRYAAQVFKPGAKTESEILGELAEFLAHKPDIFVPGEGGDAEDAE